MDWVERGKAPNQLTGQRNDPVGNPVLSRPVCQYPLVASYKGHGSTTEAKNFTCASNYR